MSGARSSIERCFGQLVLAWQILKHGIHVKSVERAQAIITCCVILHNVRKQFGCPDRNIAVDNLHYEELHNLSEAIAWITEHGGNNAFGERMSEDRRVDAVTCAVHGSQIRQKIAIYLRDTGHTRHGAEPIFTNRTIDRDSLQVDW